MDKKEKLEELLRKELQTLNENLGKDREDLSRLIEYFVGKDRARGRLSILNKATQEERVITGYYEPLFKVLSFLEQPLKELFEIEFNFSSDEASAQGKEWGALLQTEDRFREEHNLPKEK